MQTIPDQPIARLKFLRFLQVIALDFSRLFNFYSPYDTQIDIAWRNDSLLCAVI